MLALVTDAFGGRGGIAQYNRDFLGALAGSGAVSSITVLPRLAPDPVETPTGITQDPPRRDRVRYAVAALRAALTKRPDLIFCGHLYMAPLCALIARLTRAKLIVQMHGIEAWPRPSRLQRAAVEAADLVLCVSRFTRACRARLGGDCSRAVGGPAQHRGCGVYARRWIGSAGGVGTSRQARALDGRADGLARAL